MKTKLLEVQLNPAVYLLFSRKFSAKNLEYSELLNIYPWSKGINHRIVTEYIIAAPSYNLDVSMLSVEQRNNCHDYMSYGKDRIYFYTDNNVSYSADNVKMATRYAEQREKFAANSEIYNSYSNKIVRFTYAGGTNPNQPRIVKVKEIFDNHIVGIDVAQEGTRSYIVAKIKDGWRGIEILG